MNECFGWISPSGSFTGTLPEECCLAQSQCWLASWHPDIQRTYGQSPIVCPAIYGPVAQSFIWVSEDSGWHLFEFSIEEWSFYCSKSPVWLNLHHYTAVDQHYCLETGKGIVNKHIQGRLYVDHSSISSSAEGKSLWEMEKNWTANKEPCYVVFQILLFGLGRMRYIACSLGQISLSW